MEFNSHFTTKETFLKEADKVFWSLEDRKPFSLVVDMGDHSFDDFGDDDSWDRKARSFREVWWMLPPSFCRGWSSDELEFVLSVLVSHQTPNVKETQLNLRGNRIDISAATWKSISKLHNLTYLDVRFNELRVVPPLLADLLHLQHLNLGWNKISAGEAVCDLLKVSCSTTVWRRRNRKTK